MCQHGASPDSSTLIKAARALTQFYNVALEPSGLLAMQFTLLAVLAVGGPARQRVLAEQLGMDPTTLTRNLGVLERRALVDVRPDPKDRRAQRIALTAAGRAALEDAWPLWKEAQGATIARIGVGLWGTPRAIWSASQRRHGNHSPSILYPNGSICTERSEQRPWTAHRSSSPRSR